MFKTQWSSDYRSIEMTYYNYKHVLLVEYNCQIFYLIKKKIKINLDGVWLYIQPSYLQISKAKTQNEVMNILYIQHSNKYTTIQAN